MNSNLGSPPRWAELVLERLLASEDRSTVTGDLREEYADAVLPWRGRFSADLWYLRQVASLAPRCISGQNFARRTLLFASLFTLLCTCWLAIMESILRHPGYLPRFATDVSIALIPLATILVLLLHLGIRAERWLWGGAVVLSSVGIRAMVRDGHSAHFEGFVLIVSLAFILQGILVLICLGRAKPSSLAKRTMEKS